MGEESHPSGEDLAREFGEGLQSHITERFSQVRGLKFGQIDIRRIQQGAEGKYFRKFQDAFGNRRQKMGVRLEYKRGNWASISRQALLEASKVFVNRLIKVQIVGQQVVMTVVKYDVSSLTNDAVFLIETFGKIYQCVSTCPGRTPTAHAPVCVHSNSTVYSARAE